MTIHLSGQREQIVLSLLRVGKFASADEVIDEALRLVGQCFQEPGQAEDADRSRHQLERRPQRPKGTHSCRNLGEMGILADDLFFVDTDKYK